MAGYCPYCNTINESGLTVCKNPNCGKPLGKLVGHSFSGVADSPIDDFEVPAGTDDNSDFHIDGDLNFND